jgi:hypothetical protein
MKTYIEQCKSLLLALVAAFGIALAAPLTVSADDKNLPTIGWSKFAKHSKFLIGMSDKVLKEKFGDPGHIARALPDDIPKCADSTIYYCIDKRVPKDYPEELETDILALTMFSQKVHSFTVLRYMSLTFH